MKTLHLIQLIEQYKGNRQVKVDIYLKGGELLHLEDYIIENNSLYIEKQKLSVPYESISHAEIFAA